MNATVVTCGGCGKKFTWRGFVPAAPVCLKCFVRNQQELSR